MYIVTPKYKYLECLYILKHQEEYPPKSIEQAKVFKKEYESKHPFREPTPVTEEQRNYLKEKYPNLY